MQEDKNKEIGITVKKSENFSEWYDQLVLERGADLVDLRYNVKGFIVIKPWAFQIIRKIYELLENAVETDGHEPFLFPTIIPEENLNKEKEHAGFTPEVFWVTEAGSEKIEKRLALRPTGETAIYPMYHYWVRSYKDLPLKRYQSRITVFRNEMTTRPFLRGREFNFFETHNCYRNHEDLMKQIEKDMQMMKEVLYEKLFIPFYFIRRPQWDKFKGAENTYVSDTIMPDGKSSQLSSTHDLGTRFARCFDIMYVDEDGKEKYVHQSCWGPGIVRIMAALIGIHGDDNGLVLPSLVAPKHVVIVPIFFNDEKTNKKIDTVCKELKEEVENLGYNVVYDDSSDSPGFKFNHWELMGVPLRIEIGPKETESGNITLVRRTSKEKLKFARKELSKKLKEHLDLNDKEIKKRADDYFKNNTKETNDYKELQNILKDYRGFVIVPFCTDGIEGKECAAQLKADTMGANVSGVIIDNDHKVIPGSKCIVCGKKATVMVYCAKSY